MPALSVAMFADPAGRDVRAGRAAGVRAPRRVLGGRGRHPQRRAAGAGWPVRSTALTASLITHTVREPLQLWNFGHVVDRVGGCGAAWSAAVRSGVSDGPIRAMGRCGDRAAVAYAQHLDGTNIWVGAVFVARRGCCWRVFMVVSGWAVLQVSVQAIWTTVDPAARAVAGRDPRRAAAAAPSRWCGSSSGTASRCWSTSSTSA